MRGHRHQGSRLGRGTDDERRVDGQAADRRASLTSMRPSNAAATTRQVRRRSRRRRASRRNGAGVPRRPPASRRGPARHRRRTGSCAGIRRPGDALQPQDRGPGAAIERGRAPAVSSAVTRIRRRHDVGASRRRDRRPDRRGVGQRDWTNTVPPSTRPASGSPSSKAATSWSGTKSTWSQLAVCRGSARRRWSGSRSSAGPSSPSRTAGTPGRACRTARRRASRAACSW